MGMTGGSASIADARQRAAWPTDDELITRTFGGFELARRYLLGEVDGDGRPIPGPEAEPCPDADEPGPVA